MKLYGVYSGDENRNKKIWQTENAIDISSIISMDSPTLPHHYCLPYSNTTDFNSSAWKDNWVF